MYKRKHRPWWPAPSLVARRLAIHGCLHATTSPSARQSAIRRCLFPPPRHMPPPSPAMLVGPRPPLPLLPLPLLHLGRTTQNPPPDPCTPGPTYPSPAVWPSGNSSCYRVADRGFRTPLPQHVSRRSDSVVLPSLLIPALLSSPPPFHSLSPSASFDRLQQKPSPDDGEGRNTAVMGNRDPVGSRLVVHPSRTPHSPPLPGAARPPSLAHLRPPLPPVCSIMGDPTAALANHPRPFPALTL